MKVKWRSEVVGLGCRRVIDLKCETLWSYSEKKPSLTKLFTNPERTEGSEAQVLPGTI